MKQSYLCRCDLLQGEHMVLKSNRVAHNLALKQLRMQEESHLADAMSNLSVKAQPPDADATGGGQGVSLKSERVALQQPQMQPQMQQESHLARAESTQVDEMERLADLVTAITLTDDGPYNSDEFNKLWSSRSEFQATRAPHLPVNLNPITIPEVERSIGAVLLAQPDLPATHPSASIPTAAPSPPPPTSSAPGPRSKPTGAWVKKAIDIIARVEGQSRQVYATLVLSEDFDLGNAAHATQMRVRLQRAAEHVDSAGQSLKAIRRDELEVVDCKERALALLKEVDARISFLGATLPPPPPETAPVFFNSGHIYENPVGKLDAVAQIMILLGITCHVIMGLSTDSCNFILHAVTLLVKTAMATRLSGGSDGQDAYDAKQNHILDQLPTSLHTALNRFNIDSQTTTYAICPACNCSWKPSYDPVSATAAYPTECTNRIPGPSESTACGTRLLVERNGHLRPIKPFLTASFMDYLARSLSDAETERLCDKACDDAMDTLGDPPGGDVKNIFQAEFMKKFEGPTSGELFIDRGDKLRLAFAIHTDFFNPNGVRKRGNHDSIGIISLVNLSLPENIRLQPGQIYIAGVIPGPREPEKEEISHFLRPVIDECVVAWERGVHISKTASCPDEGRDAEVAIVISVNDLPAARKVSGTAGIRSQFYCTVCSCTGRHTMCNSDFHRWKARDLTEMRQQAEAWRDAQTSKEREDIFDRYGVRWSEFWRLPYWNPSQMLVVDSMHCILEGIVHYHCRYVLELDADRAKASVPKVPAFSHPWMQYNTDVPAEYHIKHDKEEKQIAELHHVLALPLNSGPESLTDVELRAKLMSKNISPLKFVCYSLGLPMEVRTDQNRPVRAKSKRHFSDLLISWRYTKPLTSGSQHIKTSTPMTIQHIQRVIKETVTPSWINSVPSNYGENSAGTIKADEWRILSTIYLPLALVSLWGEENGAAPAEDSHFLKILDHTMALFQAVTIVCRNTMNTRRATAYRNLIKQWVDGLHECHPHTVKHPLRPNVHASFHIYDFLQSFGPVMSWWCFPFERLIGTLQKLNNNGRIGGELEATIMKSYMRGANLRRWLRRPECPEVIQQFKRLFDAAFTSKNQNVEGTPTEPKSAERAYYTHNGFIFSRSSTHLGNSLILYHPTPSSKIPIVGSIQKIDTTGERVHFVVKRQATLPPTKFDPFCRYAFFPTTLYSSKMDGGPNDRICPELVVSHVARLDISSDRAVILNLSRD